MEGTYTVDTDVLSVDPLSCGTGYESNNGGNVFGLTETVVGVLTGDHLDNVFGFSGTEEGGVDRSRGDLSKQFMRHSTKN